MKRRTLIAAVCAVVAAAAVAAVLGLSSSRAQAAPKLTNITLQLKWVPQAQFAGYYAAQALGYYKTAGLNATLKPGGPDITPEQVVLSGGAQFGLDWLPNLFATREKGGNIVSIAQVFARSGMTELTWKSSGINTIAKMRGKKVAVWCCGNQPELFAALQKNGINPHNPKDVTIVQQPFDMNLFLQHKVDSASAMTYNELAQVLESGVKMSQINVIKMQDVGTGMLEDGLFSTQSYISNPKNAKTITAFVKGSLEGWIYCRDHMAACVQDTLDYGPTLPKGHQTWMMNEINKLIWPNPSGVGIMNADDYARTAQISQQFKVISKAPGNNAYTLTFAM